MSQQPEQILCMWIIWSFYADLEDVPGHGFSVEEDQISDYGSIQSNRLSPATGAWYGHYSTDFSQAKLRMVDDGVFSLGSGERAEFLDKFRVGSYLQIQQINVDPEYLIPCGAFWKEEKKGH